MALSEREQKLLEEMERNLLAQDADLAKALRGPGDSNRSAGRLVAGVLVFLVGLGFLILHRYRRRDQLPLPAGALLSRRDPRRTRL